MEKLLAFIQIPFEGTNYWIYLSSEKLSCFVCNQEGHISRHCVNIQKTSQLSGAQNSAVPSERDLSLDVNPSSTESVASLKEKDDFAVPSPIVTKRPLSSLNSSSFPASNLMRQNYLKKFKPTPTTTLSLIEEQFNPVKADTLSCLNKYKFFINVITELMHMATPRKKKINPKYIKNYKNPVSWWNYDCEKVKKLRKTAYKK